MVDHKKKLTLIILRSAAALLCSFMTKFGRFSVQGTMDRLRGVCVGGGDEQ